MSALPSASESAGAGSSAGSELAPYRRISQVHRDDIHGLVVTNNGRGDKKILSGSKDTQVKKFDLEGTFESVLAQHPASRDGAFSYENWVTALDAFPEGSFLAGHRNSFLLSKNTEGRDRPYFGKKILGREPDSSESASAGMRTGKFYKQRNETRITAVKCMKAREGFYPALIGVPEQFMKIDCTTGEILKTYRFDQPEWVYGFAPISPFLTAVIHGCALSVFKEEADRWDKVQSLVKEQVREKGFYPATGGASAGPALARAEAKGKADDADELSWRMAGASLSVHSRRRTPMQKSFGAERPVIQRPYISSVLVFDASGESAAAGSISKLALSFFGGMNQVLDLETASVIHCGSEHSERVWQAVPLPGNDSLYITCADDRSIKLWDVRAGDASQKTYSGHPGRVSALAFLDNTKFVAGTCAADPSKDLEKGQFYFYDLRRV